MGTDQVALVRKLSDGFGNGVIEATIESPKLADLDACLHLEAKVGDGLA